MHPAAYVLFLVSFLTTTTLPASTLTTDETQDESRAALEILLDEPLDVPLDADRPSFNLSPVTLQSGRFQAEAGFTWSRRGKTETWTVGESLVRLGLVEGWEFRLGVDSYRFVDRPDGRRGGWNDISIGIKRRLSLGSSATGIRPAAAVVVDTTLPTGTGDFGVGGFQPSVALALSWSPAGRWRVATTVRSAWLKSGRNAGDRSTDVDERFFEGSGGLLIGRTLTERHQVFVEAFTFVRDREHGGDDPFLQAGLIYRWYDFQLDARVGRGLGDDPEPGSDDDYFVGAGFLIKW